MTHDAFYKLTVRILKQLGIPFNDPCDPDYEGDCTVCGAGGGAGVSIDAGNALLLGSDSLPFLASPTYTQGSILFADATGGITEDNTNFFYDQPFDYLRLGDETDTPRVNARASSHAGISMTNPNGTSAIEAASFRSWGFNGSKFRLARAWGSQAVPALMPDVGAVDVYQSGSGTNTGVGRLLAEFNGGLRYSLANAGTASAHTDWENEAATLSFYMREFGSTNGDRVATGIGLSVIDTTYGSITGASSQNFHAYFRGEGWRWTNYQSSRDDSGTEAPTNFIYTGTNGEVYSAPTSILSGGCNYFPVEYQEAIPFSIAESVDFDVSAAGAQNFTFGDGGTVTLDSDTSAANGASPTTVQLDDGQSYYVEFAGGTATNGRFYVSFDLGTGESIQSGDEFEITSGTFLGVYDPDGDLSQPFGAGNPYFVTTRLIDSANPSSAVIYLELSPTNAELEFEFTSNSTLTADFRVNFGQTVLPSTTEVLLYESSCDALIYERSVDGGGVSTFNPHPNQGNLVAGWSSVSSDAGNLLTNGSDGKPLLASGGANQPNSITYTNSSGAETTDPTKLYYNETNEYFSIGPRNNTTFHRAGGFEVSNAQNWYSGGSRRAAEISVIASDLATGQAGISNDNVTFASIESCTITNTAPTGGGTAIKLMSFPYDYTGNFFDEFAGTGMLSFNGAAYLKGASDSREFFINWSNDHDLTFVQGGELARRRVRFYNGSSANVQLYGYPNTRSDAIASGVLNTLFTNATGIIQSVPYADLETVTGADSGAADTAAGVAGVPANGLYKWTDSDGGTFLMVKN